MQGHCLCSEVGFEVKGALSPIEYCHCAKCKRAYGSAFAATLYARHAGFRWLRGEACVAIYTAPLESEPPAYAHAFCTRCGSPLPIELPDWGLVEIPAASLAADPGTRPRYHMFVPQRAGWYEITDALPRHDTSPPVDAKVLSELFRGS